MTKSHRNFADQICGTPAGVKAGGKLVTKMKTLKVKNTSEIPGESIRG